MLARVIKSPVVSLNVTVNGGGFPVKEGPGQGVGVVIAPCLCIGLP